MSKKNFTASRTRIAIHFVNHIGKSFLGFLGRIFQGVSGGFQENFLRVLGVLAWILLSFLGA
jgi:hypothetical protein